MNLHDGYCIGCGMRVQPIGIEYPYGDPNRIDGVSEWMCPQCGRREGRWTHDVLLSADDREPRYGRTN